MQLLRLCIKDPCPIILIFIFMREKKLFGSSISVFVIRCHGKHFPRNVFNYKKKNENSLVSKRTLRPPSMPSFKKLSFIFSKLW